MMKKYPIAVYRSQAEVFFDTRTVARLARVSEEFIWQCEAEDLVSTDIMLHGQRGLCCADIHKLKLIRHLHDDLGLNLEAVDLVMRYRSRINTFRRQVAEMERRLKQKELEYQAKLQILRQQLPDRSSD